MKQEIISKTVQYVKKTLKNSEKGHDWWHTYRVWKLSKFIAKKEKTDNIIIDLGALLHDIADSKFYNGDEKIGPKKAKVFLEKLELKTQIISHVVKIIENISFSKKQNFRSKELDIIQDADRLDAIGAIGIARTFNYGGYKNRELYNPTIKPNLNMTKSEYKKSTSPTINHFYEKLLTLKDQMNTKTAKNLAKKRHKFMIKFLNQFYKEWKIK